MQMLPGMNDLLTQSDALFANKRKIEPISSNSLFYAKFRLNRVEQSLRVTFATLVSILHFIFFFVRSFVLPAHSRYINILSDLMDV